MVLTKEAIVGKAAEEARGILGAAPGLAADAAAQYVKEGTPSGLIPNLGVAVARQACRRWADLPNLTSDAVDAGYERVCRPYLDDIGYGAGPTLKKPFIGGQCYGIQYRGTYTFRDPNTGNLRDGQTDFVGRLVGLGEQDNGNGTKSGGPLVQGQPGGAIQLIPLGTTFSNLPLDQSVRDLVVVGAGVDNCGDPPAVVTPPTGPGGPTITIEPIIIVPILDVDADVTVNIDGTIDVDIDGVEVTIDPFGGDDSPSGGIGGDDLVPGEGLAGSPADAVDGGTAGDDAPPGQELVGVRVEVIEAPIGFNQYANNPAVVYRGIGYMRMGYPGKLALDVGGSAVISPQFFIAPVRGLTSWEHRANLGFINRCTPFYRELPS